MISNNLEVRILSGLEDTAERHGFRLERSEEVGEFFHTRENGWDRFMIIFNEYDDHVEIKTSMGIRFDAVEDIFHRSSGFSLDDQKSTTTVGCFIRDYVSEEQFSELSISKKSNDLGVDEAEVRHATSALQKQLTDVALPYFERFESLEDVHEALNASPDTPSVHKPFWPHRCITGVVVAKLVDDPNCSELVDQYRSKLESFANGFYLSSLEALCEDLGSQ